MRHGFLCTAAWPVEGSVETASPCENVGPAGTLFNAALWDEGRPGAELAGLVGLSLCARVPHEFKQGRSMLMPVGDIWPAKRLETTLDADMLDEEMTAMREGAFRGVPKGILKTAAVACAHRPFVCSCMVPAVVDPDWCCYSSRLPFENGCFAKRALSSEGHMPFISRTSGFFQELAA